MERNYPALSALLLSMGMPILFYTKLRRGLQDHGNQPWQSACDLRTPATIGCKAVLSQTHTNAQTLKDIHQCLTHALALTDQNRLLHWGALTKPVSPTRGTVYRPSYMSGLP